MDEFNKTSITPLWDKDMLPCVIENLDVFLQSVNKNDLVRALISLPHDLVNLALLQINLEPNLYKISLEFGITLPNIIIDRLIILNRIGKINKSNWPIDVWYGFLFRSLRNLWEYENKLDFKHQYPIDKWGLLDEDYDKIPVSRSVVKKLIKLEN